MLTVASFFGNFLPRGSFLTIILKGDMLAQNCSQGLPLKFQAGTFGAIKFFRKKLFTQVMNALVSSNTNLGKKSPKKRRNYYVKK